MPVSKGGQLITIDVVGHRNLQGRFVRASQELTRALREETREMGRRLVSIFRAEAPIRTGRLRRGIGFRTRDLGRSIDMRITSEAPYTRYVIRGRRAVYPVKAKALRFEPGPPGSGFIYRKRVRPAKANPFHERAYARAGYEQTMAVRRMAQRVHVALGYQTGGGTNI